ncbi:MAG: hypothetical protein HY787_10870 [Deltaproteobacteria bacterium]|nr:hypothetical protein [Deltaproteobacteria bacterium]
MIPGWVKVKEAAKYAGVSPRTLEDWLKQGLKYTQMPTGLRLLKPEWIDQFLERFLVTPSSNHVDQIVDEIMGKIT